MRLRRLETFGFKSFADHLTFEFEDGITAIIGPNGCGKSNVVDAIKWVIGEQSAKALRGAEMTDVIFNGCSTRKGMPYCEVTLYLDNVGHSLPGIDADDIAITRRLGRDGLSEYRLNGKSCRLKDIRELFMGTGMGTSAYAVIEQGRVGFILEANTKDRRLILEEASGISRFKARRRLAQRKLERVEIDLQRIAEVLAEVRRRAKAVARQAEAALRWKELTALIDQLRLAFALEEFGRLSEERTRRRLEIEQLALAMAEGAARLGQLEASSQSDEVALATIDADMRRIGDERAATQGRRDVADHRISNAQLQLADLDRQEAEDQVALIGLMARLESVADDHRAAQADLERLSAEAGQDVGQQAGPGPLTRKREELEAVLAEVDAVVRQVEDAKAKQLECFKELARIEAEHGRLESARSATADRRRRLEERSGGQAGALMDAMRAEGEAKQVLETALIAAAEAHRGLDERIRAHETAQSEGSRLDGELTDIGHQLARVETSLRMFRDQEQRAEGVQRGPRDVLMHMKGSNGIVGMVADLCRIPDADVMAIETALGGQAQNIVTETQADAKDAIEFLKRERRGRATFLPLDDVSGGERIDARLLREPGVVGIASRLISYESRLRPVFESLLGNVLVVESLDDGMAVRRRHRPGCRIVTRDGEVINAGGAMTGGRQQGQESGGLVSRKHEIARLAEQQVELAARRGELAQKRESLKKEAFSLNLAVDECRRAIQAADRAVGDAKAQLMKAERDRLHSETAASGFGAELEEIASELGRLESEGRDLLGQREWFGAVQRTIDGQLESLQGQLALRGAQRDRLQDEFNSLRVSAATTAERLEAARNHLGHITRQMQDVEDRSAECQRRLENVGRRRDELRQELDAAAQVFATEAANTTAYAERLDALQLERSALAVRVDEARQELRALAARSKAVERERQQAELALNAAEVRLEAVTAQVLESHRIDIAEAFGNWQRPADFDPAAERRRLEAAEDEREALGPPNLAAIDELEEAEARVAFLDRQFGDLQKAMDTLTSTIDELNRICGERFAETYRQVRANFQLMFRKLFGGGRADLELETKDENGVAVDPLEAGLEIVACPPGKNPKIITQLSGGEKALTAIALLFAVYRTKPSPFCILDEVDAPLDEANVDVYNNVVREFTRTADGIGSQFIVITHRKRTMQRADAIYGITQNEPGVSTRVSVRFSELESGLLGGGELQATTRGAGPFAG